MFGIQLRICQSVRCTYLVKYELCPRLIARDLVAEVAVGVGGRAADVGVERMICGTDGGCGSGLRFSLTHENSTNATNARSTRLFVCFITTVLSSFGFAKIQLFHRMEDYFFADE